MDDMILDDYSLEEIAGKVSNFYNFKKEFKAWHKPRKQWVRSCQWKNSLNHLLEDVSYNDITTIKYFSLPGEDCLDIKVLSEQCHTNNKKFYFQGIESNDICAQKSQSSVVSQIMDLEYIDPKSTLHAKSCFEEIRGKNSSLFAKLSECAPFHIINLDFTNSIFSHSKGRSTMQAICTFLNKQLDQQYLKWQLYVTTRCNLEAIDVDILKEYMETILNNCEENPKFETLMRNSNYTSLQEPFTIDNLIEDSDYIEKLVIVAFLKWLTILAVKKNVKISLFSSAEYTVKNEATCPDMVSLVIEFKKNNAPIDPTNINYDAVSLNEKELALNVCSKFFSKTKNVDTLLIENETIHNCLKDEIKNLLKNIGYDISLYPY